MKDTASNERTAASALIGLLKMVGVGPGNLVLTTENLPWSIDAEAVQGAHDILHAQREEGGGDTDGVPYYCVFSDAQARRIFPDGIKQPHCEYGWQMMQKLVGFAALHRVVTVEDRTFSEIIEDVIAGEGKKSAAREELPMVLFGREGGGEQQTEVGFATAMFYALEKAGMLPEGAADKLAVFCIKHPDKALEFMAGASALLESVAPKAIEYGDYRTIGVSTTASVPSAGGILASSVSMGELNLADFCPVCADEAERGQGADPQDIDKDGGAS